MNSPITTLLYEWKNRKLPETIKRDISIEKYITKPKKIVVLSGFRRVGKTYILFDLIKELLKAHDREEVIYINFEDERIPNTIEFLSSIIPAIKENFRKETRYLILDEIQEIEGWSKWLRRVYDNYDFNILVTGSSSKVSSKEIPTELRGRSITLTISPLSFWEYLRFKKIKVSLDDISNTPDIKAMIYRELNEYLRYGGLPEIVLSKEKEKKNEILQDYFRTVVNKEIIERYNIKNEEGIKSLLRILMNSTSYSVNKIYNIMKSLNMKIGKTALLNYVGYIENSYFMDSLLIFSKKVKDQLQYPKKNYFIDNGFINALALKFSDNNSRFLENSVFLKLKDKYSGDINKQLHYWKSSSGEEVDFVVLDGNKVKELIQVCYDIDDYDTKKRELKGIIKASDELKCNKLIIITFNKEGKESSKKKNIEYIPIYKFLLS